MIDLSRVQSVQQHYASLHPRVMPIRVIATDPQFVNQSRYAGSVAAYSWVSEVVSSPQADRRDRPQCLDCILSSGYVCPPRVAVRFGGFGMALPLAKQASNVR